MLLVALLLIVVVSSAALLLTLAAPDATSLDVAERADRASAAPHRGSDSIARCWSSMSTGSAVRCGSISASPCFTRARSTTLLGERALNTAVLAATALVLATAIGLPLGIYTGRRSRGWGVMIVRGLSVLLLSTPPLLASLVLVLVAARTGWLPVGGMVSAAASDASWHQWALDVAQPPAAASACAGVAARGDARTAAVAGIQ